MVSGRRPLPILFDTDIGSDVDDALALGLLLGAREVLDLVAVTTVSADVRVRARIAAGLLALAGRADVPVCAGEADPVLRPAARFNWFGHEAQCIPTGVDAAVSDEAAPACILRLAREIPDLEIVLVGPLTNLARALAEDPELPRRVGGITVMGGHIREARIGGFVAPHGIDYNLCSDPEASVAVLGAGFRTRLVTADVTLSTWLRAADLEKLEAATPFARELARQVRLWEPLQRRIFTGIGGRVEADNVAFLHDPLTVQALIDPAPLGFEELRVVTTLENGILRTHEVTDAGVGAPMSVATSVDAEAAERAIAAGLLAL